MSITTGSTSCTRFHQLYVGITNNLRRRVAEHKEHRSGTYTAGYDIDRLVFFRHFPYVRNAIAFEKKLKDWNRGRKIAFIEEENRCGLILQLSGEQNRRFLRCAAE